MRTLLILLLMVTATFAQGIQKWQTPEGGLYFGDKPPPGSMLLETIEGGGTVSSPEMTHQQAAPSPAELGIVEKRKAARAEEERQREARANAVKIVSYTSTPTSVGYVMLGTVQNTFSETIRGVEVGADRTWVRTVPTDIAPGAYAAFSFTLPKGPGSTAPALEARWVGR